MAWSPEWNDFYPDAIYRNTQREIHEEQTPLDATLQEQVQTGEKQRKVWEWNQNQNEQQERERQVHEILQKLEKFAEKKGIHGYDVFEKMIQRVSLETQVLLLDKSNIRNFSKKIETTGVFPVYEFEFKQFIIENTSLIREETKEEDKIRNTDTVQKEADAVQKEEGAVQKEEGAVQKEADTVQKEADAVQKEAEHNEKEKWLKEKGKRILDIKRDIDISWYSPNFSRYEELVLKEWNWNKEELQEAERIQDEIINAIKQWKTLEKEILPQAYAQWPEVFQRVSENLSSLDPSFQSRIDAWNLGIEYKYTELPVEQRVRVSAALWKRVDEVDEVAEKSGNIFSLETPDGFDIDYDVVADTRSLTLDGYTLESQVEDKSDYQTPKLEYMRSEQEHLPKIKIINEISETLKSKGVGLDDLAEIKATLRTIPGINELGINFESMDSWEEIRNALEMSIKEHQNSLRESREKYRATLLKLRNVHFQALREKDEKTKEILQFLQDIGFTMIPQSISDDIIRQINLNPTQLDLGNGIHFNTAIDLKNGVLGTDIVGDNENTVKRIFSRFVNKMLTGDPDIPIVFSQNGQIRYNIAPGAQKWENPEMVGKGAFQMLVQQITGKANFDMIARNNLNMIPKAEK